MVEAGDKSSAEFGAQGGKARASRLTPEQRREISRKAAEARWGAQGRLKALRATHEGPLHIAGTIIPCAVLEDGTKVLSRAGFSRWWVLVAFLPIVAWLGIWVFAYVRWPKLDPPREGL